MPAQAECSFLRLMQVAYNLGQYRGSVGDDPAAMRDVTAFLGADDCKTPIASILSADQIATLRLLLQRD